MKKLLYLALLLTGFTQAQIVNIPDANFKAKLLASNSSNHIAYIDYGTTGSYGNIDANLDGEIQYSEALSILELNVESSNIIDLTGIEAFTNIWKLSISNNNILNLDLSALINNLNLLYCSNCNLTNYDFNSLINLTQLDCSSNNISNLNISNLTNLSGLTCSHNQLSNLNIDTFHLTSLDCSFNQISTLNFDFPLELNGLDISNNNFNSINILQFPNLVDLYCENNQINSLDFSNVNLWNLRCGPVSELINVENMTNLRNFILYGNSQQTTLDMSNSTFLDQLGLYDSNYTDINLSGCTQLNNFFVLNNINLNYLYLNNGKIWTGEVGDFNSYGIQISNCPNLNFICTNENNILKLNQVLNYYSNNNLNCVINSYCSFTPGGNYNTITGNITFDADNNGCDSNDLPQSNIRMNMTQWGINNATFSNNSGNYTFYTTFADQSVEPSIENPTWFNITPPSATISFADLNNNTTTQDFCLSANGVHRDVEVVITPIIPARPGFDAVYKIVYRNKGNQTLSQQYGINFFFNQNQMNYVSSSVTPTTAALTALTWDYADLQPFESREILVTFSINAPTDTNPVNIGDELTFTTAILPQAEDENTMDNLFILNQTVVGSYDPNDITCLEGSIVSPSQIGNYLHYNVRFENTGTAAAENIVVKIDVNPADFDINSLQLMNASHPVDARITENKIEFIFENINLDSGGHGNVLLKVKSKSNLVQGDLVEKRANIYFDYNFPIETNNAETVFQALNNPNFEQDNSIKIYPNPTSSIVTINGNFNIKSFELFDVQGRLLETNLVNQQATTLDISSKSKGIYFIKVTSEKGIKVEKIIKE